MPITFQCPSCQHTLRVPDHMAGRSGKCPRCTLSLTVPSGDDNPFGFSEPGQALVGSVGGRKVDAPTPEDEKVSAELKQIRRAYGWQSVVGGLNNIWLGSGLQVLGVTTVEVVSRILLRMTQGTTMVATGDTAAADQTAQMGKILIPSCMAVFVLSGTLIRLLGFFRCLGTPAAARARLFAFGMLGCELLVLVSFTVGLAAALLTPPQPGESLTTGTTIFVIGELFAALMALAGLALLLLYCRQLGRVLGIKAIAARLRNFLYWFVGGGFIAAPLLMGCNWGLFALGAKLGTSSVLDILRIASFCISLPTIIILPLTLLIKYLGTLSLVAEEIRKRTKDSWV